MGAFDLPYSGIRTRTFSSRNAPMRILMISECKGEFEHPLIEKDHLGD